MLARMGAAPAAFAILIGCQSPAPIQQGSDESSGQSPTGGASGGGRASLGDTTLPCGAHEVLQVSCQGCHARSPGSLAPMALITREDLLAPAISDPAVRVIDLVMERVHDSQAPMPPAPGRRLLDEEIAVLADLAAMDVPAGGEACESLAGPGSATVSGDEVSQVDEQEIDQCYRLAAHDVAEPGDETPFSAPTGEYYACFYFDIPWPADSQAVSFRSLDTRLTHHWTLADTVREFEAGAVLRDQPHCGLGTKHLLAVYGKGQQRVLDMPDGVGLELPQPNSDRGLLLGVHYFNTGAAIGDQTGVEVCTAKRPREHAATVSLLGTEWFVLPPAKDTILNSVCTPGYREDIHIFRSFPHMHSRGIAFTSVIERAGNNPVPMLDVPYDWNNQLMYDTPAVVHPGDRVRTSCHFRNDTDRYIRAGDLEGNEMCINFVYAYPAHALAHGTALSGAADTCLQ